MSKITLFIGLLYFSDNLWLS